MAPIDYDAFNFRPFVEEKGKKLDEDKAAELAANVQPHRLVAYELTPAGCPRPALGGVWNPVPGSGPFRPWMVPKQCLLADWVVATLRILSKLPFKVPGATAGSDLADWSGFGFNAKGTVQSRNSKTSQKTAGFLGHTLYDAEGRILTLDNCEMRGQLPEDAQRPVGLINETNFPSQPGNTALWFNSFYHGAYTSNPLEAKAFSQLWIASFANFDLEDKNPYTRQLEQENCRERFAAYKLEREGKLMGTALPGKKGAPAPPLNGKKSGKKANPSAETEKPTKKKNVGAKTPAGQETTAERYLRLAKSAEEEAAAKETAAKAAAAKEAAAKAAAVAAQAAVKIASIPKSAADRAAYYQRLAKEAADQDAAEKAAKEAAEAKATEAAEAAAAKKAAEDAAAEEARVAEEEAAALPPAERAARYLQLAKQAEERVSEENARGDAIAPAENVADDAGEAALPHEDHAPDHARPDVEDDAAPAQDPMGADEEGIEPAADEIAALRQANSEKGQQNSARLSNAVPGDIVQRGGSIESNLVTEAAKCVINALNTYIGIGIIHKDKVELGEADDEILPSLHTQIELIYTRKHQRQVEVDEQAAEDERASKVPKN